MHFPAEELERRLTEFQVVHSAEGRLIGALGLQIERQHGRLHSECYGDFSLADEMRPLLMQRISSLASNHGVFRLWTQEQAPFWSQHGFQRADYEALKKLPEKWAGAGSEWRTFQLKDEAAILSLEKEMALLMQTEKQRTARIIKHVSTLKSVALWLAVVLGMLVLGAAIYLFLKNPGLLNPQR